MKPRPIYLIFILGALTTISPFSIDMYLPAFQQIADDLHTTVSRVSLSLSGYFIGLALGQILYGPCLDRFGRKKPLYFGLSVYILASLACLFAPNVESLIALRFVQALGGCVGSVAAMAMVRDFYPLSEGARVFSKLMLILSVSPLFAPTVGGFIAATWGWHAVFVSLAVIVALILAVVVFFLPEGHTPDPTISLNPRSIGKEFASILRDRQFFTYAVSGSFSFSGLFIYLAGSPAIFLNTFQLSEKAFGAVFAFLSVGVIGGGQVNIFLTKRFSSEDIFKVATYVQTVVAAIFAIGTALGWYGFYGHLAMFFVFLSCIGLTFPNAAVLALAPFSRNSGSASALLGSLQMAVGAVSAAIFGVFTLSASVSMGILFLITSAIGALIFTFAKGKVQIAAETSEMGSLH